MTNEEKASYIARELVNMGVRGKFDIANKAAIMMAKWKDKQLSSVDTIKKIVCYALRYTNIMLADDLENGVNWELLIKKAMEHKEDDDK